LKKDKFKSARGGYSRLYEIYCRKCETRILTYQKDGPGSLRRLYFDRINDLDPSVQFLEGNIKDTPSLICKNCNEILGNPYIYVKEKRGAFRIHQNAVVKKLKK